MVYPRYFFNIEILIVPFSTVRGMVGRLNILIQFKDLIAQSKVKYPFLIVHRIFIWIHVTILKKAAVRFLLGKTSD